MALVAHELKSPATLIAGSLEGLDHYLERLREFVQVAGKFAPEHPELARLYDDLRAAQVLDNAGTLLSICGQGASRIERMIGQLRGYAQRRQAQAAAAPVGLAETLSRAVLLAKAGRVSLPEIERTVAADLTVVADEDALTGVLVNLIANAMDAADGPGGRVSVLASEQPACVEVRVRDNGPGVPAELRARIFDPYFTTKGDRAGFGVGLTIAREAAEAMGGRLFLAADEGRGAEFVLCLPGRAVAEAACDTVRSKGAGMKDEG